MNRSLKPLMSDDPLKDAVVFLVFLLGAKQKRVEESRRNQGVYRYTFYISIECRK